MITSGYVRYHEDLEPWLRPIDSIHPAPYNYNNGDVEKIAESIEVNGMYRPVYVQKSTGDIIAGNHTWLACKSLGAERVPVVELDVDDATAVRVMLADNQTARLAKPDNSQLLALLTQVATHDSLLGTGFEPYDLEALEALSKVPVEYDEFAQWPTICVQVPPHVRKAYFRMTEVAVGDKERFEMLLRLAGWDGKKD